MTFDECELKAKELRLKDPTAGTDNKLLMYLPSQYDKGKYLCLIKWTRTYGYKKAFITCNCEMENLSIYFYDPEKSPLELALTLAIN